MPPCAATCCPGCHHLLPPLGPTCGFTVEQLDREFPRSQRHLGLARVGRQYDLRQTAITHAIAYAQVTAGVSIADVACWAGEGSPGLADVMVAAYGSGLADVVEARDEPGSAASASA
jgi:hypothetical protein